MVLTLTLSGREDIVYSSGSTEAVHVWQTIRVDVPAQKEGFYVILETRYTGQSAGYLLALDNMILESEACFVHGKFSQHDF